MKKNIWILSSNKNDLYDAQRIIDQGGGMKAICMTSREAIECAYERMIKEEDNSIRPSVLIVDYDTGMEEEFSSLKYALSKEAFAGVPLFFMSKLKLEEIDEKCYELGATVVVKKPFSDITVKRIERVAWQQEMTRNYENFLYRQAQQLQNAREIKRLNEMLATRNQVLKQVFGKYFSSNIVDVILDSPDGASLGGDKRDAAVIMADLRGFTSLSDTLSADALVDILDLFLEGMTKIISKYKGTVIEFLGDAVLAIFGEPFIHDNPELEAIKAAIEMQNCMTEINEKNNQKGYPSIEMGIGIHKGEVFVGNIGSEYMMRYNVVGQAVNICSRIQSYSLGGQILCSDRTLENIRKNVGLGESFEITIKGVRGNIDIKEIVSVYYRDECISLNVRKKQPLMQPDKKIPALIYEIQDKRVDTSAIHGHIEALSKDRIIFISSNNEMKELADYIDVEVVVAGKNAYGKVIRLEDKKIEIDFTYKSKGFLDL